MHLKQPKGIRDVAEWYMSTMIRPDYIHEVFARQTEIAIHNLNKIHEELTHQPDIVFICGTDFGTQDSQFCSIDTFRSLYMPYYQRINHWIHEHTGWKTFKHSCGAVEPLMESFIDSGFDIINPVQVNAAGMDPYHLKDRYGDRLIFWGGGVDTQHILPYGTPEQVKDNVKRNIEALAPGGGFVFSTIHNIQAEVPPQNVVALIEAFKEFGKY